MRWNGAWKCESSVQLGMVCKNTGEGIIQEERRERERVRERERQRERDR